MNLTHEELQAGTFIWYDFKDNSNILLISTEQNILHEILPWRYNCTIVHEATIEAVLQNRKKQLYDYILVTGEYQNPLERLPNLLDYLNDDGIILLALNNRYGARQMVGEATAGMLPFEALERGKSTYTRADIITAMEVNGNLSYSIYYPVPDWHQPQILYSDSRLPGKELDERLVRLNQTSDTLVANEYDILHDAVVNKAFPFVANSFLIECCRHKDNLSRTSFATFTSDRGKDRSLVTIIYSEGVVKKTCIYQNGLVHLQKMMEAAKDLTEHHVDFVPMSYQKNAIFMQYVDAPTLMEYLWEIVQKNKNEYLILWEKFWEIIKDSSKHVPAECNIWLSLAPDVDWGPILERAYVEMNALNCFFNDERFLFFDQEYCFNNCPATFMLYRSIYNFYLFYPEAERYVPQIQVIAHFCLEKLWPLLQRLDAEAFLKDVRNWDKYADVYDWGRKPLQGITRNRRSLVLAAHQDDIDCVYSFDVFDTLIVRRTAFAVGIFAIIQEKLRNEKKYSKISERLRGGFFDLRQLAERIAREKYCTEEHEDITLEDIYEVLQDLCNLSDDESKQIADLERENEIENALPILENLQLLRNKIEDGRKVFLIVDTYIDEITIRNMLKTAYPSILWDAIPIYVSGKCGKTKQKGTLFKYVQEQEGIYAMHWLHIGSNQYLDIESAKKLGILTLHYSQSHLTHQEKLLLYKYEQSYSMQLTVGHVRYSRINPREKTISLDDIPHPSLHHIPYGLANRYPIGLLPKRVALYGAGKLGVCLWNKLCESSWHEVACWVDGNAGNLTAQGLPVKPIKDLLSTRDLYSAVVIAVLKKDVADDIREVLYSMGFLEDEIIWIEPTWL